MKKYFTNFAVLLLAMLIALPTISFSADSDVEEMKRKLPKLLGASNVGTEFYITFHPPYPESGAGNFLKVYVSSGVRTEVKLDIPSKSYSDIKFTKPNDIIEFELTPGNALCYYKVPADQPQKEKVFKGAAVHLTSKDPIIVYGVIRYVYTSDGYLAVPLSGFGKEYVVASWPDPFGGDQNRWLNSWTSIISAYDNTTARVKFGGEVWTETAGGKEPGQTSNFYMDQSDVVLIGTVSKHGDLTGTKVNGNKPLGVISGNFCAFVPTGVWACDVLIEMELPTNTWGTEYHVTPIYGRDKNSFIRVFAKESNTQIYRNRKPIGIIPKSGGLHGEGWLEYRAADGDPIPVVISGDKPISITQYNPGINDDSANDTDPFQMILTPLEQYQEEIVFNTPGIRGGLGFDNNFINLVYEATQYGTIPDDLMFAEVKDSEFEWKQLNAMEADPGTEFTVKINGDKRYFSKTIRLPHDGVYKIKANAPFTAYAYGNSWCDTYGFPTSVALGDLSIPDTVCPFVEWEMDCLGHVDGTAKDMPDEAEYRSNLSLVYMDSEFSYNFVFERDKFIPGETRSIKWTLDVIDDQQEAHANLVFIDRRGNDTTIYVDFYPTLIDIVEDEWDYGRQPIGTKVQHTFKVVNKSEVGDLDLSQLKLQSGKKGFKIINKPLGIIPPLGDAEFTVEFEATEEGHFEDSIGVGDPCFFWYKAYVEAEVGAPRIAVSYNDFGKVRIGDDPEYGLLTVENIGTSPLEIYDYTFGDHFKSKVYKLTEGYIPEDISEETPWILEPGDNEVFEVSFTPELEQDYIDTVKFISNTERPEGVEVDSCGEITGTGIKSALTANGYNWMRRRIHRPSTFPVDPYPVDAGDNPVIMLKNAGSEDLMILKAVVDEGTKINGDAFKYEKAAFVNHELEKKDENDKPGEHHVEVQFQPTVTGEHYLKLIIKTGQADIEQESILQGIGIVGRVQTADVDFGQTETNNYAQVQTREYTLTNIHRSAWEYCDSVTVTAFDIQPAGAIETAINGDVYGTEGFRFDINNLSVKDFNGDIIKTGLSLPITLQPGENIVTDVQFVATASRNLQATITSVSDAEADVPSVWTGTGYDLAVVPAIAPYTVCVGETPVYPLTLTYSGAAQAGNEQPINVTNIVFATATPEITFDNLPDFPMTINPGETKTINIKYMPTSAGNHDAVVRVTADINAPNDIIDIDVNCDAVHYDRSVSVNLPAKHKDSETHQILNIGDKGTINLRLDPGVDISMANITKMNFKVKYESEFIKLTSGGIKSLLSGYSVTNVFVDHENGVATFSLEGPAFTNQSDVNIVEITYGAYLPRTDIDHSTFEVSVDADGSLCVDMTATGSTVEVRKTCVYDLRKVILNASGYALQAINPNPVRESADIEFSVGMDTQTTVEIFNSMGELVACPVNKVMESGQYSVNVPVSDLNSGTYWVRMTSGSFTQQQKMIIVK